MSMTKHQIVALVRQLISDEQAAGFSAGEGNLEWPEGTDELLNYLDRAVDALSEERAAAGDIRFLKTLDFTDGQRLPSDFIRFAGLVPVETDGERIRFYGEATTLRVKYFARLKHISRMNGKNKLPFRLDECRRVAALAAIYALNKHEFTVSQDLMLLGMGGEGQ